MVAGRVVTLSPAVSAQPASQRTMSNCAAMRAQSSAARVMSSRFNSPPSDAAASNAARAERNSVTALRPLPRLDNVMAAFSQKWPSV